jgi:hypothetical protein
MLSKEAPLLFLGQCNDRAFERNLQQLVALGAYSHAAMKDLVASTGIAYNRLEKGIDLPSALWAAPTPRPTSLAMYARSPRRCPPSAWRGVQLFVQPRGDLLAARRQYY